MIFDFEENELTIDFKVVDDPNYIILYNRM
jgi:hypothetical protein